MGLIKEPMGVDLVVAPSTLTEKDRKMISEVIANYKRTNTIIKTQKVELRGRKTALRTPKLKNLV